ncbi:MAG: ATP synthase F1 subunit gamma [Deltaproteobacteria bacterium]|nr:ATP synthase F1 subunit gamma [Deltaproteobacteria bacterium]
MAGLKEIDRRRKSVRNTKKITYAMKLVSAAKLRKAQEAVTRSRQYTDAINGLLAQILQETGDGGFSHPLMQAHNEVKTIGFLVVGGGRGLCGGYNTNLNKKVDAFIKEKTASGATASISYILGKKPAEHYRRVKREYVKSYEKLGEDANTWPVDEVCQELEQQFLDGKIDELYVIYTKFKSALSMTPTADKLLPMDPSSLPAVSSTGAQGSGTTIFEPSAGEVFSALIPRIMRSKVRQAALDAKASEQGSRMTAMENATKNATEIIYTLDLKYNKLRQSRITAELLDIIGGAEAL